MAEKKKKKKKGCLGMFVNLIIGLVCLAVTALIIYFSWLVVKDTPDTDPVEELKKLPQQLMELPTTIQEYLNKDKGGESAEAQ